jgi:hypothetical protein
MFDFINTPTVGQQQIGPSGAVYQYDGTKWVAVAAQVAVPSQGNVGRNLIHNPMFNVAQRGAGPFTAYGYTLDRWFQWISGGDAISTVPFDINDAGRVAIGDEAASQMIASTVTGTNTASSETSLSQYMENVRRLGGKAVTVSFWAQASAALKLGASIDQLFGTGGSPSARVNGNGQSVTLATSWARYTLTFNVPSTAGKTLGTNGNDSTQLSLWLSCSSANADYVRSGSIGQQSGTINLWGIQLEIAAPGQTQPTPLERIEYADDLRHSQRFYQTGLLFLATNNNAASGQLQIAAPFPVVMRATPTAAIVSNASTNISGLALGATATTIFNTAANNSGAAGVLCIINVSWTASADL